MVKVLFLMKVVFVVAKVLLAVLVAVFFVEVWCCW